MAIAVALLAPLLFLFQLSPSTARYTLRGSVVNSATGEPVRKAVVMVSGVESKQDFTGADGQFQFADLPAGAYSVSARRPGFLDPSGRIPGPIPAGGWFGADFAPNVTLGADTQPVTVKLVPQARVSGRVLDAEGEPVPNIQVLCLQQSIVAGHQRWVQAQTAAADEAGNFLIDSLAPGKVLLATSQQQVYPGLVADDQTSRLIYPKQYYPNAPDLASAQAIDLSPGQDAQTDMTVSALLGARVFFSVTPPQPWIQASLIDPAGDEIESQVRQNVRNGGWILPSVPPGQWRLLVRSNSGEPASGEANIDVGQADVTNVAIGLSQAVQVPVSVSGGSADNAAHQVDIQLMSASPGASAGGSMMFGMDDHKLTGVVPGTYYVTVTAIGGADCIDSVTAGGVDLTRNLYVFAAAGSPAPINIGLRADCANVEFANNGGPGSPAAIVISGGVHSLQPQLLFTMGSASARLTPGEYEVYAFANVNSVEYANPDVLKGFEGHHLSVAPNQKTTVHLEVIGQGEHR